jgi:hypothetical protein
MDKVWRTVEEDGAEQLLLYEAQQEERCMIVQPQILQKRRRHYT